MSDYIDWGLRRRRRPPLPVAGEARQDEEGRTARFSLALDGDVITDVTFDATACVTLVAYCELLCRRVTGRSLRDAARRAGPLDLVSELPLVPAAKRPRARLASQACIAAILAAAQEERA